MDGREQDGWMDCVIERLADGGSHAWTDWWVDGDKADKRHKMYVQTDGRINWLIIGQIWLADRKKE